MADPSPVVNPLDAELMIVSSREIWSYKRMWHILSQSCSYSCHIHCCFPSGLIGRLPESSRKQKPLCFLYSLQNHEAIKPLFVMTIQNVSTAKWSYEISSVSFPPSSWLLALGFSLMQISEAFSKFPPENGLVFLPHCQAARKIAENVKQVQKWVTARDWRVWRARKKAGI